MKFCNLISRDTECKDTACIGCLVDYRNARPAQDVGAGRPESLVLLLSVTDGADSFLFYRDL